MASASSHGVMRVKIVCDSIHGPRIYDRDGNEILAGCVRSVRWEWEVGGCPRAYIQTLPAALEVEAEVDGMECSLGQPAAAEGVSR